MIRAILALVLIAAAVAAAVFIADNPGHVEIVWQGWQADTSVGVLAGAIALLVVVAALLVLLVAALRRIPRNLRRRRAARRRRAGEAILTRGLVALAAGEVAEAGRHARRAVVLLDGAPVPLLLAAEAATRQGDAVAARQSYTQLLERPETEFLGLRGLIGQAVRAGDDNAALRLAERARQRRAGAGWLLDTLLLLQARAGDWPAALATIGDAARRRALPAAQARHHQGVVLLELSRAAERRGEVRQAAKLAARAQALAADLAAPALQHARLLIGLGRRRAAARAIERAWRTAPHPGLAGLYLDIDPEAGVLARAAKAQRLAAQNPAAVESHLAVAEAALTAQLWGEARRHLALALAALQAASQAASGEPPRRLCLLMARLEEGEAGDTKAARAWLGRAIGAPPDLAHVCRQCGAASPEWRPLCPECGGFDTLAWDSPAARSVSAVAQSEEIALMLPSPAAPDQPVRLGGGPAIG